MRSVRSMLDEIATDTALPGLEVADAFCRPDGPCPHAGRLNGSGSGNNRFTIWDVDS